MAGFDPYANWLGIAPAEQPPDAYRLLGLPRYESDTAKISAAIEARRTLLRAQQQGPHAEQAKRLLVEVEKAESSLTDSAAKSRYDMMLKLTYPAGADADETAASGDSTADSTGAKPRTAKKAEVDPISEAAQPAAAMPLAAPLGATPVTPPPAVTPLAAQPVATASSTPIDAGTLQASDPAAFAPAPTHARRRLRPTPLLIAAGVGALLLGLLSTALLARWFGADSTEPVVEVVDAQENIEPREGSSSPSLDDRERTPIESSQTGSSQTSSPSVANEHAAAADASEPDVETLVPQAAAQPATDRLASTPPSSQSSSHPSTPGRSDTAASGSSPAPAENSSVAAASEVPPIADSSVPDSESANAWPDFLPLPSLLVKQPQSLLELGDLEELELELNDEHADLGGWRLKLQSVSDAEDRWRVVLTANKSETESAAAATATSANQEVEIAQLAARDGQLMFVWTEGAPLETAKQLQNCVLHLASGETYHAFALRAPVQKPAVPVSLASRTDVRILPISDIPSRDNVELQVKPLLSFPVPANWKNGKLNAKIGQWVSIALAEYPGAEIRFKVDRKGADQLAIFVSPIYKPNARVSMDLSLERLKKMEQATKKALVAAQRDQVKTNARLSGLRSRKSSVDAMPARNAFQQQAKATAQYEVNRDITAANRKLASLKVRIPEMEARLRTLPSSKSVIDKIHLKAFVNLQVQCVGDVDTLVLYRAETAN